MATAYSNHAGHAASKDRSARSHSVSNPFDSDDDETPKITSSKVRGGTNSASSSSRYTNPFEDDGVPHIVKAGRRNSDPSNPFDDDEETSVVKHVTNGHKSRPSKSGYSSGSAREGSNPFDDVDEVTSKPKARGDNILDNGSLFEDDERLAKPTKETSSSRGFTAKLKAGGSKFVEGSARIRDSASSTLSNVRMPSLPTFPSSSSSQADDKSESKRSKSKQQMRDLYGEPQPSYVSSQQDFYGQQDHSRYADQTVEQLEQHAINKSQDTTSSIRSCIRIAEDTVGVATTTMETLHDQGDQIRRTHETAVRVDEELSRGEKLLGSLGGMFTKTWKPKKGRPITGPQADPNQYRRKGNGGDRDRAGLGLTGNHDERRHSGNHSGLTGAQAQLEMEREKQDDALTDLSNVLGQLKNMTVDMGNEIERQNGDLDRMHDDVTVLNERVKGANTRTRRLIAR